MKRTERFECMVLAFQISKNVLSGMRHFIMWSLFLSKLIIKSSISLQFFVSLLLNNSAAQWVRTLTTYDTKKLNFYYFYLPKHFWSIIVKFEISKPGKVF